MTILPSPLILSPAYSLHQQHCPPFCSKNNPCPLLTPGLCTCCLGIPCLCGSFTPTSAQLSTYERCFSYPLCLKKTPPLSHSLSSPLFFFLVIITTGQITTVCMCVCVCVCILLNDMKLFSSIYPDLL